MKFVNHTFPILVVGIFIQVLPGVLRAADQQPNGQAPTATTSSDGGDALKVPPAVPLDELPEPAASAPSVGAKKSNAVRVKAPNAEIPTPSPEATVTETEKVVVEEAVTETVQTPPTVSAQPEPAAAAPEVKTATPAAIPAEPATATAPRAPAPTTIEEAQTIIKTVEEGPSGSAQPIVSMPMRAADEKIVKDAEKKREEEGVYFNVAGEDIREIIKQISRVTGTNFILDDKVRGEITIISEQKLTVDEVYEAFLAALDVVGYTTVPGPAGLTNIVKKRDALSSPIPIYTEKTPYTASMITRLLTLKNIRAVDMANAIKGLVSKEGNLFAYPATNTLILTDTGTNIDRIVRMVQELDTEGPQEVLEIIPIEYADVKDIADKITKLFGGATTTSTRGTTARARRRRGEAASTPDAIPPLSKVIPDERTNSIILLASKITIAQVRDVIRRLDRPLIGPEEGDIHVLYLKNAKAVELAEVLTGVTEAAKKGTQQDQQQQRRGTRQPTVPKAEFQGLFGSIKSIRADEQTNALIIQANAKDFKTLIERIIAKLDIPRRQVYVEATIMEISFIKDTNFGTGLLGGKVFSAGGNNLALFGNTFPFIPSITTTASVGGITTSNPINVTPPFSTDTLTFPKFFAAIVAQQGDTELNVLSTPNILTLDNEEARIKVGDTIPFLTGSALTTGGVSTSNVQREDVALELSVTPQITEGDNVRMEIKQIIEDFSTAPNPLAETAGPATSIREIESNVVVPDNQTVVLGGLMQDKDSRGTTKIPLLGDIPILGWLFKATAISKRKVNLLIFLTPSIIREPGDFLVVMRRKIEQRNLFIDEHYGEKARKRIRARIEQHNARLLDFEHAASVLSEPDLLAQEGALGMPLSVPGETAAEASTPTAAPAPVQEAIDADLSAQGAYEPDLAIESEPASVQRNWKKMTPKQRREAQKAAESQAAASAARTQEGAVASSPAPASPPAAQQTPPDKNGAMPSDIDLAF